MTPEELKKLAQHLKNPQGIQGIQVAQNMNQSNEQMIRKSIKFLDIQPKQKILEIGHANGAHVQEFFKIANSIQFYGLETSDTMYREAQKYNRKLNATFHLYDGIIIPFDENFFDRIISVNTLYFWSDPQKLLNEIEQTLKPKGIAVLTFIDKTFMQNLSFVGQEFTLYDLKDFNQLIQTSQIQIIDTQEETEKVKSKTGDWVERKYTMVKLQK